jgi:hypothetical protein
VLFGHGPHYVSGQSKYSVFFTIDPFHEKVALSSYNVLFSGFLLNINEKVVPKH